MKAFTDFVFLPASAHWWCGLLWKTCLACVFSWHFNGRLLHEFLFILCNSVHLKPGWYVTSNAWKLNRRVRQQTKKSTQTIFAKDTNKPYYFTKI